MSRTSTVKDCRRTTHTSVYHMVRLSPSGRQSTDSPNISPAGGRKTATTDSPNNSSPGDFYAILLIRAITQVLVTLKPIY